MKREDNQSEDTTSKNQRTTLAQGARWKYEDISLELTAHLIRGQARYAIPTYPGEGWGHVHLKVVIAAHLLHWGYKWDDMLWEYDPPDITGRRTADVFVREQNHLPSFWFECRTTDDTKLLELRVIDSRRGQRAHPEVKIKFDENGFPIPEVKAGSKRELNNILKGIKKKYGQIAQTTEITAEPISLGVVEYENTVGGRLFMRSVAKTAYLFLASRLPKEKVLSDAFKSIRDFIFEDQGESLTSFNFVHTKFMSNDTRPLLRYCLNPLTGNEISVKREFVLPDVTTDECLTPVQTTQFVFTEIEKGLRKIELYCESISKTTVEFLEPQTT